MAERETGEDWERLRETMGDWGWLRERETEGDWERLRERDWGRLGEAERG